MSLTLAPVSFRQAADFVALYHRHHKPPVGMKFALGVRQDGMLVGVAMVGRPVNRTLDDGLTLEVNRTCVLDGAKNANSFLYGASWRATKALGYTRLVTYTRADESGASLRGAGWRPVRQMAYHSGWDRPNRSREDPTDLVRRILWEVRA